MQALKAASWKIESLTSKLQGKPKDYLNRLNRPFISAVRLFLPFNHLIIFHKSIQTVFTPNRPAWTAASSACLLGFTHPQLFLFHFTHPHKTGGGILYEKRLAYVSVFYIVSVINNQPKEDMTPVTELETAEIRALIYHYGRIRERIATNNAAMERLTALQHEHDRRVAIINDEVKR